MVYVKIRQQVLERDQYTCQICLKYFTKDQLGKLDTHHLIPKRKQGLDSIHNLTSVCEICHPLIELKLYKTSNLYGQYTTISCDEEVRDRLKKFGTKGETYEVILIRLMDESSKRNGKNEV